MECLEQPTWPVKSAHQSGVLSVLRWPEEQRLEEEGQEDPKKRGRKGKEEMEDKERLTAGSQANSKLPLLSENKTLGHGPLPPFTGVSSKANPAQKHPFCTF